MEIHVSANGAIQPAVNATTGARYRAASSHQHRHAVAHLLYAAGLYVHGRESLQRYEVVEDLPAQHNERRPTDGTGTDVQYIHPEVEIDVANVIRRFMAMPAKAAASRQAATDDTAANTAASAAAATAPVKRRRLEDI